MAAVFQGPVLLHDNTRRANYSYYDFLIIPENLTAVPAYGAGIFATNASLLVNGVLSLLRNKPGALLLQASTATFTQAVAARNNQDTSGVLLITDSTAIFQGPFTCSQDSQQYDPQSPLPLHTTTCIRAERSSLELAGPVSATNGLQMPCGYHGVPCENRGGAALSCEGSSIRFKGRARFVGNAYAGAEGWGTVEPVTELGGGAWRLHSCRVAAEQWVGFTGNAAGVEKYLWQELSGGAVCAVNSSMVFQGGLALTGNNASRGGGVWLTDSRMKLSGGRLVCKDNVAQLSGDDCVGLAGDSHWDHP